jgi:ubiquinone biosynthesis protein
MQYLAFARRVGDTVRLAQVLQVLAKHGFADVVQKLGIHRSLPARVLRRIRLGEAPHGRPETTGARLREAFTELGPTFVKLGQVLSTRPDILSKELRDELAHLQDRVGPLPYDTMRAVVERSLGKPLDHLFREFPETPLASASLSQVYKAKLPSGQIVAVKVRRPNIRQVVDADISLMTTLAEWIEVHVEDLKWLDARELIREFSRTIHREMDFTIEARTIQRFHDNFKEDPTVEIPRVFPELSSPEVLTMSFIDGVRVDARSEYAARRSEPREVAQIGCHAVFKQIFDYNLFHADPHPGNILLTRDNRLGFIDFGMVGRLEATDIGIMSDLLRAVFIQDSRRVTDAMLLLTDATDLEDVAALQREVADYLAFEAQSIISGGEVGKALEKIVDMLSRHGLRLPSRFSLLIKALSTIESTGHALDPALNVLPILRPYVENAIRRRFAPGEVLDEAQDYFFRMLRMMRELPVDAHVLMQMARHGKFNIKFTHQGLERLTAAVDRASDRVAYSVMAGSIVIGSSWLLASGVPGTRTLGLAGYVAAGALGLVLLVSILRSRKL